MDYQLPLEQINHFVLIICTYDQVGIDPRNFGLRAVMLH